MVEVPPLPATASWQRSSASADGANCVQVTRGQEHVWVRDSKNPRGPVLSFTRKGWEVFIDAVQRGDFDRSGVPA